MNACVNNNNKLMQNKRLYLRCSCPPHRLGALASIRLFWRKPEATATVSLNKSFPVHNERGEYLSF